MIEDGVVAQLQGTPAVAAEPPHAPEANESNGASQASAAQDANGGAAAPLALTAPVEGEGIVAEFNAWLRQLVQEEGSDLHVKVGSAPLLRIDGRLRRLDREPLVADDATALGEAIIPADRVAVFAEG